MTYILYVNIHVNTPDNDAISVMCDIEILFWIMDILALDILFSMMYFLKSFSDVVSAYDCYR